MMNRRQLFRLAFAAVSSAYGVGAVAKKPCKIFYATQKVELHSVSHIGGTRFPDIYVDEYCEISPELFETSWRVRWSRL